MAENRIDRAFRTLSACNRALVRAQSETQLLAEIPRILVELAGYRMCWVGYAEDDSAKTVRPVARWGGEAGYLEGGATWDNSPRGRGPSGSAVRTGKPVYVRDIRTDPNFAPWRDAALALGFGSCVACPLIGEGRTFGVLTVHADGADAFADEELRLLEELAEDLAYGISALRGQEALRASEERFALAMRGANDGLWDWDLKTDACYFSPRWKAMLGYAEDEIAGRVDEWERLLNPHDKHRVFTILKDYLEGRSESYDLEFRLRHRDGHDIDVLARGFAVRDETGQPVRLIGTHVDISERKRGEETLRDLTREQQSILANAIVGIFYLVNRRFAWVNERFAEISGYAAKDLIGQSTEMFYRSAADYEASGKAIYAALRKDGRFTFEREFTRKDGSTLWAETSGQTIEGGVDETDSIWVFHDITERKKGEEALRALAREQESILANAIVGICHLQGRRFRWANERIVKMFGYGAGELIGRTTEMLYPSPDEYEACGKSIYDGLLRDRHFAFEHLMKRKDGSLFWAHLSGQSIEGGGDEFDSIWVIDDVTARKEAELALEKSEAKYRRLAENINDWAWEVDASGVYTYCSPRSRDLLGYAPEEIVGRTPFDLMPAREAARMREIFADRVRDPRAIVRLENVNLRKDGDEVVLETSALPVFDSKGAFRGYRGIDRDVTERKEIERALHARDAILSAVSEATELLLRTHTWRQAMPDILASLGKATRASRVLMFENRRGDDGDLLTSLRYQWAAPGLAPRIGEAMTQNASYRKLELSRWAEAFARGEIVSGPISTFSPSERRVLEHTGVLSKAIVPIFANGGWWGQIGFDDCVEERIWTQAEIDALRTAAGLIGAVIEREGTEDALRERDARLQQSLLGTIKALARTVEARDPYTSGHQGRVAALAAAIARKMGLGEDHVLGIEMGALIHDIGKIYIPGEILTRPGRITEEEFNLIKTHPRVGYDIVKDVEMSWPVADMILQHHERLDGTGYPQGLEGDAICLEARILSVADVMEAMSSHRPYRPALPLEKGLEEIVSHRGTWFDGDVVDACVRVVRDQGFELAQPAAAAS